MIKTLTRTLLVAVVLGFSGIHLAEAAKKPVDKFAKFKGAFRGTASVVVSSGGVPILGTGTIVATGPKNGASLKVVVKGGLNTGGTPFPYTTKFTFTKSGAYLVSDGIFGLVGTTKFPFQGKAKLAPALSGNGFFTLETTQEFASFSIKSSTVGRKQTLTVSYVLQNSSGIYPFKFVASRMIKKTK